LGTPQPASSGETSGSPEFAYELRVDVIFIPSFEIQQRDLLNARVIVQTYNQHVRLLFSEPGAIAIAKFTQVEGADIVMKSTGS
jgi:hypothetical protein